MLDLVRTARTTYGYDANGNLTDRGPDDFGYDHENRLVEAVIGGVTSTSTYNGDGLRMSLEVDDGVNPPETTDYAWDVNRGLPVVLDDGTNKYVYGLDLIAAIDGSDDETYYTYDGLGSTTDLSDENGSVTDTYSYDVFGAGPRAGQSVPMLVSVQQASLTPLCRETRGGLPRRAQAR